MSVGWLNVLILNPISFQLRIEDVSAFLLQNVRTNYLLFSATIKQQLQYNKSNKEKKHIDNIINFQLNRSIA